MSLPVARIEPMGEITFTDFNDEGIDLDEVRQGKRILWFMLQGMLNEARPGVSLCHPGVTPGTDPNLPLMNFLVHEEAEVVGIFNLYNIRLEGAVFSAMPCPGLKPFAGSTVDETWHAVMDHFLRVDIDLADGRSLGLYAWDFPTDDGHHWDGVGPYNTLVVDALSRSWTVRRDESDRLTRIDRGDH